MKVINVAELNEAGYLDAGPVNALPVGSAIRITYKRLQIGLFHQPEGFFAVKDDCPHAGDCLSGGEVADGIVTCPGHSWQFELATGDCTRGDTSCSIRTYPVTIRNDHLGIKLF